MFILKVKKAVLIHCHTLANCSINVTFLLNVTFWIIKLQIGKKVAFFLVVSMTCFHLTATYIHVTLEVRIPSICATAGQMVGNFCSVFKAQKHLISLGLKFRMALVLLCSLLSSSHFSWYIEAYCLYFS